MKKITVLCLFGGKSTEYEVSLMSAYSILTNIDREKYDIVTVGITKDGDWYHYTGALEDIRSGSWSSDTAALESAAISPSASDSALLIFNADGTYRKLHIDVVLPIMHGANAEDGTLQGLMKISGIPFVGCGCTTSAIGMDKSFTKLVLKNFGIPQARSMIVRADSLDANLPQIIERCEQISPYPLFVKPANAGSSVGASKAGSRDELISALHDAARFDDKLVIEEYINGKEVEVAVMGKRRFTASTPGQINPGSDFYDYDTKYSAGSTASYSIPAEIAPDTAAGIRSTAVKICSILGVEGLSRVDFFVRSKNGHEEFIFNEINTLPGFTQISMYPKLMMHDGMTYPQIIDSLIDIALGKEN